jgi:transposase InsO family protein
MANTFCSKINTAKTTDMSRRCHQLHTDQGSEYMANKFQAELTQLAIRHNPTAPYTPEHNGVAERFNHTITTITTIAHALLTESSLGKEYCISIDQGHSDLTR